MAKKLTREQAATEHVVFLALGKACYKYADVQLEMLLAKRNRTAIGLKLDRKEVNKRIQEALDLIFATVQGRRFRVSDKFAGRNSIPVGQSARRFELEEV
jgi:hypothetical protein